MSVTAIVAGAALGLASAPHCAAMCGPLAGCASTRRRGAVGYHAARLAAYATAGALAGFGSRFAQEALLGQAAGAVFSWSVAIALAIVAWRLWRAAPSRPLVTLGRRERTWTDRVFDALPKHPVAIGAMTALLPCGVLYAALALAAGSGGAAEGALTLTAFGLVSGVGLAAVGAVVRPLGRLVARPLVGKALATACLVAAVVFAVRPVASLTAGPADACHAPVAADAR